MMTKFLINHRDEDDDESLGSFYLEHNFLKFYISSVKSSLDQN